MHEGSSNIDRRTAIRLGLSAAAAATAAGVAVSSGGWSSLASFVGGDAAGAATPAAHDIVSSGGRLEGLLRASGDPFVLAGQTVTGGLSYNGVFPGPTLWAKPGDRVLLDVKNDTPEHLNTHFHGLHVTPDGKGDNVLAMVHPGETFHHDFVIPADHPGGLFWYHPHHHGSVDQQIFRGLSGLIVIDGGAATLPGLVDATQVTMALKNFAVVGDVVQPIAFSPFEQHTVNNELMPTFTMAPGETQLWRIANIGNDPYYRLALDGHTFTVVAEDGILRWQTSTVSELLVPPGKRFEVAVTGGPAGTHTLRQLGYYEGPFGVWPEVALATVEVTGTAQTPAVVTTTPRPREDWAGEPIVAHRTVTMSEAFDVATLTPLFMMNGVRFQEITPGDIIQVEVGTVEEWVIRNDQSVRNLGLPEEHPFHIHINPFVVVGTGTWNPWTGQPTSFVPVDPLGVQDIVSVKPNEYALIRMKFEEFTGSTVFHCHIGFHEDGGMMGRFDINAPGPLSAAPTTTAPANPVAAPAGATVAQPVAARPSFTG